MSNATVNRSPDSMGLVPCHIVDGKSTSRPGLGSTVLIVMQSFLNIGVATGVLPTTGLPFPFVSYGGNAMLASLAVAGFLIRAGREMSTAEVIPFPRRFDGVPSGDGDKAIIKSSRLPRVRQF